MKPNAYILDWTMEDYTGLLNALFEYDFEYQKEPGSEHVRVAVSFEELNVFTELVQKHLNQPFNYVDIQYPEQQKTVVIFQQERFIITSVEQNEQVKTWAIDLGLPPQQADWGMSF